MQYVHCLIIVYVKGGSLVNIRFRAKCQDFCCNISNMRDSVSSIYPNTEKGVENMVYSGVFLSKSEMFV